MKSRTRAILSHLPLSQPYKKLLHFNQFRNPFFLVCQLVLALQSSEHYSCRKDSTVSYLTFLMFLWLLPLPILGALFLVERLKRSDK